MRILFVSILTFVLGRNMVAANGVLEELEGKYEVFEKDMYTMVYADEFVRELEETCSVNSLRLAKEYSERVRDTLGEEYTSMSDQEVLDASWELYEQIDEQHPRIDSFDSEEYCVAKHIFYDMQAWLRDVHVSLLDATGLSNDFGEFDVNSLHGLSAKLDLLDEKISQYERYSKRIDLEIEEENTGFEDRLDTEELQLFEKMKELFEHVIAYSLVSLQQDGVLTKKDIDRVKDTFVFDYQAGCELFHGNYEIRETIDYQGKHVAYETTALRMKMNYCPNYFVLRNLDTILSQLMVHEMGHHVYYYIDDDAAAFEALCWSDGDTRKQKCSGKDFVSKYAQSFAVEDYADHFMYRYLDMSGQDATSILRDKSQHFSRLFN